MVSKQKTNILITGAGGFLGTVLTTHLAASPHALRLAARKKISVPKNARALYGDLTNPAYCKKIVKGIDVVYYTAGFKKNIAVHTGTPYEALAGNVLPLLTFLSAAKKSNIKKLIYVSSTIVEYASLSDEKIDGYVWGKYINEMALKAFAKEVDIDIKIVRSAPLYGAGDSFDPKTANFIPAFIRRVAGAKGEVVIWGNGKRTLQFIYVDDLVRNLMAASTSSRTFFVFGNKERVTVNDIARNIIKISGRTLGLRHDLTKPDKKTMLSSFDNLVKPKIDMEAGLKKTLQYYRTHHA
ncbi:NAD-dependent epimerase/dehydratase family protein [Candidatus Kaiserbacteria bacterium]|nr:NAD-dependent epimerase/dehydratase family protein [Candidatus Kaiserbacteria bacterium]